MSQRQNARPKNSPALRASVVNASYRAALIGMGGASATRRIHSRPPKMTRQIAIACVPLMKPRNSAAAGIAAEELDEVASDAVDDHVRADDFAFELLAPDQPDQKDAVAELQHHFVELGRVQRDIQRSADDLVAPADCGRSPPRVRESRGHSSSRRRSNPRVQTRAPTPGQAQRRHTSATPACG